MYDNVLQQRISELNNIEIKRMKFVIKGNPLSSKRPRTGKFGNFYVPDAAKNKKMIREAIIGELNGKNNGNITTELYVKLLVYLPIPKSFSKIDKELCELKYIRPIIKPDVDNISKTYLDALNCFLWHDDAQVVDLICKKYYSKDPRLVFIVEYKNDHTSKFFQRRSKNLKNKRSKK